MKSVFTTFLFLLLTFCSQAQKRFDLHLTLDGFNRECIIVKPSTAPPDGGYPVVFMLHGTSGDGEKFYNISGWKELGEQENFITVFPSSLSWCWVEDGVEKHNTRWVNGNVTDNPCSGPPQDYVDDVKFLKYLVTLISDTFPVNEEKVFASGFSNGSSMIHKLAIDAGDIFKAVAGCSAPLAMGDSSKPINRIPIWFMVGSLDDRFIVPPFTELPFGGDSILSYLNGPLTRALSCQGLTESFTKNETSITHTYIFNESQDGESSQPYLFTLIKNMTHLYPNGVNFPVDAPRLFWDFFNRSTMANTQTKAPEKATLEVYPNPASDYAEICFKANPSEKLALVNIYNSTGQMMRTQQCKAGSKLTLHKTDFGNGVFFVQLRSANSVQCAKLIFH